MKKELPACPVETTLMLISDRWKVLIIRDLLGKKRKGTGAMEEKEKQRLYGFFMRKGFASSDILEVFRESEQENF